MHICPLTLIQALSSHPSTKVKKATNVKNHLLQALAYIGTPNTTKTDNNPAYTSTYIQNSYALFNITHITGIPYSPQRQNIIKRAHRTYKTCLEKIKKGELSPLCQHPQQLNSLILYIINFLNRDKDGLSRADRHWQSITQSPALVKWRDTLTTQWRGPDRLIAQVRGSVCILPTGEDVPVWVPIRCVRPVCRHTSGD